MRAMRSKRKSAQDEQRGRGVEVAAFGSVTPLRIRNDPLLASLYARHVAEKLTTLSVGRIVTSTIVARLRDALSDISGPVEETSVRTAVLAHIYYPELLPELVDCRRWLPQGTPLHLTVPYAQVRAVKARTRAMVDVTIHEVENRGRDIAPFMQVLKSGCLDHYDAVLKIHGKRSLHLLDGDIRRRLLLLGLAGSPPVLVRILRQFEHATTGIVGWRQSYRRGRFYWRHNERRVRELVSQMGGDGGNVTLGFFEGSMFWFRPAAFVPLRNLAVGALDFECEQGQLDGTLHHAIERVFCSAARISGHAVLDTRGSSLD